MIYCVDSLWLSQSDSIICNVIDCLWKPRWSRCVIGQLVFHRFCQKAFDAVFRGGDASAKTCRGKELAQIDFHQQSRRYCVTCNNSKTIHEQKNCQVRTTPPATPAPASLASAMARDAQQRQEPWHVQVEGAKQVKDEKILLLLHSCVFLRNLLRPLHLVFAYIEAFRNRPRGRLSHPWAANHCREGPLCAARGGIEGSTEAFGKGHLQTRTMLWNALEWQCLDIYRLNKCIFKDVGGFSSPSCEAYFAEFVNLASPTFGCHWIPLMPQVFVQANFRGTVQHEVQRDCEVGFLRVWTRRLYGTGTFFVHLCRLMVVGKMAEGQNAVHDIVHLISSFPLACFFNVLGLDKQLANGAKGWTVLCNVPKSQSTDTVVNWFQESSTFQNEHVWYMFKFKCN